MDTPLDSEAPLQLRPDRRNSGKGNWNETEDLLLMKLVRENQGKNWKQVAEHFVGRTDVQCLHRWQKVLNPSLVKGPWSPAEDEALTKLVSIHGIKGWSMIASKLPGRIGKQCRERWFNHLDPNIKKDAWSPEDDAKIMAAVASMGPKWAEIAKLLHGRSDNAIKNRYNSSIRKRCRHDSSAISEKNLDISLSSSQVENDAVAAVAESQQEAVDGMADPHRPLSESFLNPLVEATLALSSLMSPRQCSASSCSTNRKSPPTQPRTKRGQLSFCETASKKSCCSHPENSNANSNTWKESSSSNSSTLNSAESTPILAFQQAAGRISPMNCSNFGTSAANACVQSPLLNFELQMQLMHFARVLKLIQPNSAGFGLTPGSGATFGFSDVSEMRV